MEGSTRGPIEVCSYNFNVETEEIKKDRIQNIQRPGRDSNQPPTGYKRRALLLHDVFCKNEVDDNTGQNKNRQRENIRKQGKLTSLCFDTEL
jgi:hypothetical protein